MHGSHTTVRSNDAWSEFQNRCSGATCAALVAQRSRRSFPHHLQAFHDLYTILEPHSWPRFNTTWLSHAGTLMALM